MRLAVDGGGGLTRLMGLGEGKDLGRRDETGWVVDKASMVRIERRREMGEIEGYIEGE